MNNRCYKCDAPLSKDEIAVYRKMVERNADKYLCKVCLADFFGCATEHIDKKIEQFRHVGCVLFSDNEPSLD